MHVYNIANLPKLIPSQLKSIEFKCADCFRCFRCGEYNRFVQDKAAEAMKEVEADRIKRADDASIGARSVRSDSLSSTTGESSDEHECDWSSASFFAAFLTTAFSGAASTEREQEIELVAGSQV